MTTEQGKAACPVFSVADILGSDAAAALDVDPEMPIETLRRWIENGPSIVFAGLREMIDTARLNGYECVTLTDLEHAIDLAEEHAYDVTRRDNTDCPSP